MNLLRKNEGIFLQLESGVLGEVGVWVVLMVEVGKLWYVLDRRLTGCHAEKCIIVDWDGVQCVLSREISRHRLLEGLDLAIEPQRTVS